MSELYPQDAYELASRMRKSRLSDDKIQTALLNKGLTEYQIQALINGLSAAQPRRQGIFQRLDFEQIGLYLAGGAVFLMIGFILSYMSYQNAIATRATEFHLFWQPIGVGIFLVLLGLAKATSNRE